MTRFIQITDTHWGTDEMGFQQQPAYVERLPELIRLLDEWIALNGPVDFVLHSGDLLDQCTPDLIREAEQIFTFQNAPFYLCLGNHDMLGKDVPAQWLAGASRFFPGNDIHGEIITEDMVLHIVPNHWDEDDYIWKDPQNARLSREQQNRILEVVSQYESLPHVLCFHSQVSPIPREQSGEHVPLHLPFPSFVDSVRALIRMAPAVRLVIGGHNHANVLREWGGIITVTTASFSSTPFEFKLIEITPERLRIETLDLLDAVSFHARYDFDRTFVQGRSCDRRGEWTLE